MEFPVPSYLVALVAGDLQHVDVGPRSVTHSLDCLLVPVLLSGFLFKSDAGSNQMKKMAE